MGAAQRTSEINGGRNPEAPHNRDLKHADLRAGGDGRTDASAAKKYEQERADEFANRPLRNRRACNFDIGADIRWRLRARRPHRLVQCRLARIVCRHS